MDYWRDHPKKSIGPIRPSGPISPMKLRSPAANISLTDSAVCPRSMGIAANFRISWQIAIDGTYETSGTNDLVWFLLLASPRRTSLSCPPSPLTVLLTLPRLLPCAKRRLCSVPLSEAIRPLKRRAPVPCPVKRRAPNGRLPVCPAALERSFALQLGGNPMGVESASSLMVALLESRSRLRKSNWILTGVDLDSRALSLSVKNPIL